MCLGGFSWQDMQMFIIFYSLIIICCNVFSSFRLFTAFFSISDALNISVYLFLLGVFFRINL